MRHVPSRAKIDLMRRIALVTLVIVLGLSSGTTRASTVSGVLDPAVAAALQQQGISVVAISDDTAVDASTAVSAARDAIPLVAGAKSSVSLVTFTDSQSSDGSGGRIYVDREAWAVVFTDVAMPILGPTPVKWGFYNSNTVVLVDARTGMYLEAFAYGSPRA